VETATEASCLRLVRLGSIVGFGGALLVDPSGRERQIEDDISFAALQTEYSPQMNIAIHTVYMQL